MRAAFTHTLEIGERVEETRWADLPDGPGVAAFVHQDDRTVLLATTANARALAKRRLGAEADGGEATTEMAAGAGPGARRTKRRGVDLRGAVKRVRVVEVGSAFEAEAVYLEMARERLPHVYRVVAESWRAWFVHVDAAAEFPRFSKTNLSGPGSVAARSAGTPLEDGDGIGARGGVLLGPLPDKDSAGRLIEAIVDCFDLCRFHHILVQSPHASACTYKELGRCPAPCDGSESLASYRSRVERAVEETRAECAGESRAGEEGANGGRDGVSLPVLRERLKVEMTAAAGDGRFEIAAGLRDRLKRLSVFESRSFAQVRLLDDCRWLIVQRSPGARRARCFYADAAGMESLGDVDGVDAGAAREVLARLNAASAGRRSRAPGPATGDTIGLVARHLFMAKAKRAGAFITIGEREGRPTESEVAGAIRATLSPRAHDGAVEDREIGAA